MRCSLSTLVRWTALPNTLLAWPPFILRSGWKWSVHPTDLGINDTCKEAVAKARGEFLVLLNNDTVVTNGWLNQLLGLLTFSPAVGMAGPMSNYAAPPQLVETVPYRVGPKKLGKLEGRYGVSEVLVDVESVESFAREFREKNRGKWTDAERLGGFCLAIKRDALVRMGPLDSFTDLGLFDTDILSTKARQAGYTLACCRDLFIHHFGTRTFAAGAPGSSGVGDNGRQ